MACELDCGDIFDNTKFPLVVHWNRASISNGLRDISIEANVNVNVIVVLNANVLRLDEDRRQRRSETSI